VDRLGISGGYSLSGTVPISGAKNAALPCLAASMLAEGGVALGHLPAVADIRTMIKVLGSLGCGVEADRDGAFELRAAIETKGLEKGSMEAPYDLVKTMRASILALGPLLARFGRASVSLPGGCAIGARPVNLHLDALQRMGADIRIDGGYIMAAVKGGRLKGIDHTFEKVSVGATENILMAASLAKGTTVLRNAAVEPEIVDLARMLRAMGAEVEGEGTPTLVLNGRDSLGGCRHYVIPDRIEAGTFICALAAAGGEIVLERVAPDDLRPLMCLMAMAGCDIEEEEMEGLDGGGADGRSGHGGHRRLRASRPPGRPLRPGDVTTEPHPGFPTDLQAQVMAVMTQAAGTSTIRETIFENRFQHAMELERLGAGLRVEGNTAIVTGPSPLAGCTVMATDLRASAALVIAGMVARGDTTIDRIYHLDRGYSRIEIKLQGLGAKVRRVKGGSV
jgi:UDP-N-acetylglucosamine 1-carboxyvinyltransferase